ncbi:MAG: septum formation initiator family protein [Actinobacteria bacterium]|nr:MAG: septum formation initiator family protein [Actinomycetota bacterium]
MSAAARSVRARRRVRFTPRGALLALVVMALLFYLVVPMRTYVSQRNRLDQLERQTELLVRQNADLQSRVKLLGDPRYIERVARECLGMVKKGEIGFIVVPRSGPPQPASC